MVQKSIIVAEKPSVAMSYSKALKVNGERKDGYIEGDEWIVTWCVGHLVTLCYPEEYDPDLKRWSMDTIPFLPDKYKYHVIPDVKKQFEVVKKLYNRPDIGAIYYAGDAGREGVYIQMLVRQEAGHNPDAKEYVVWIDSQTDDEIRRGVREAKPVEAYKNLSDSGYMRAIEDFSVGINFSRAMSLKYQEMLQIKSPIAVGRVMTCVLGMVVNREKEIERFKPTQFYKVHSKIEVDGEEIEAEWKPKQEAPYLYNGIGFLDKKMAESFAQSLPDSISIEDVTNKEEKKFAPTLFNQTELQAYCSRMLKISPDETLQIAQSLYEKKMTTYPRTSARVLTSAIAAEIERNLNGLMSYSQDVKEAIVEAKSTGAVSRVMKMIKYVNDKEVEDHYAIIPTGQIVNTSGLSELEKAVYDFIVKRFISIFMPPAVYRKLKITEFAGKEEFIATGSALVDPGYYKIAGVPKQSTGLPPAAGQLQKGQIYDASYTICPGETKPPARYTSGSIVLAMENAGQLIEDEELRATAQKMGIGTDATRAETIKKLVKIKYLDLNKKTQVLTPAPFGRCVYEIVRTTVPSMLNPEVTASWENGLSQVASGAITANTYYQKMQNFVIRNVAGIKAADPNDGRLSAAITPYRAKVAAMKAPKKKFKVEAAAYLNVPYDSREEVKSLGAYWDSERSAWYVPKGKDTAPFSKWLADGVPAKTNGKKTYLKVSFDDKDEAKAAGARWDGEKKSWYMPSGADKSKFKKWLS